jgi:hypothetical protein
VTRSQFTQYATGFWGSAVRTRVEAVGPTKVRSCVAVVGEHQIACGPTWTEAYHDLRSRLETEERCRNEAHVARAIERDMEREFPDGIPSGNQSYDITASQLAEVARVVDGR